MRFSDNAMTALLLCSYLGIGKGDSLKPLTIGEWNQFLENIIEMECEPCAVLAQNAKILEKMQYSSEYIERVNKLISRGASVAFELDDLEKKGIGIVTIFDSDYPVLLKRRLKRKAPPVLYFAGDIKLAGKVGIAVVGSRNVDHEGQEFTKKLVRKAAQERLIVYSGGARGVDTISEEMAINNGSAAVSFISDSLLTRVKKKATLDYITQRKILLLSDVRPDVGFTAARAMNRNKYIYASSYGAFVISSDYRKGGTWSGATDALRNGWTKVLVWNHKEYIGNTKLIGLGAFSYDLSEEKIYDVITRKENTFEQLDIFSMDRAAMVCEDKVEYGHSDKSEDIYYIVKEHILNHLGSGMSVDEASEMFNIAKGQMNIWLKRLCKECLVEIRDGRYIKKQLSED